DRGNLQLSAGAQSLLRRQSYPDPVDHLATELEHFPLALGHIASPACLKVVAALFRRQRLHELCLSFPVACAAHWRQGARRKENARVATIFVVPAVSSMKMRRGAWSLGCSALRAARSAATSGRSCSPARFFRRDCRGAPDRADASFLLLPLAQPRAVSLS